MRSTGKGALWRVTMTAPRQPPSSPTESLFKTIPEYVLSPRVPRHILPRGYRSKRNPSGTMSRHFNSPGAPPSQHAGVPEVPIVVAWSL